MDRNEIQPERRRFKIHAIAWNQIWLRSAKNGTMIGEKRLQQEQTLEQTFALSSVLANIKDT
jgi:hypothetical protein